VIGKSSLTCLLVFLLGSSAVAQNWATKMFDETSHDFGTVARGAAAEHRFTFTNPYQETVTLRSVRSSCGCATPKIITQSVASGETGEVLVTFNTPSHTGQRTATVTVTFDQPYFAEAQLKIYGFIRKDVVFSPGSVQFGNVDQGQESEKLVTVSYAGRDDWQIRDVQSTSNDVEVEIHEASRGGGRVTYRLLVRLKDTASVGYIKNRLVLMTNDQRLATIPLDFEARIQPEITVAPSNLYLGELAVGETVSKSLIVRGKQPFKITDIECDDDCFSFTVDEDAKKVHIVKLAFEPNRSGEVRMPILIHTDLGETFTATITTYASVAEKTALRP